MSSFTTDPKTWVEISEEALLNNVKIVRGLLKPSTRLMAVVKSNAYGHGLVETVKILLPECLEVELPNILSNIRGARFLGADWLGVDNVDEAILLRENSIKAPILVLGYTPANRLAEAVRWDIKLTCYDQELFKSMAKFPISPTPPKQPLRLRRPGNIQFPIKFQAPSSKLQFHLKVDSGMSRQGVTLTDLPKFLKSLPPGAKIEGVYTHFANADNLEDREYPNLQLHNFRRARKIMEDHGLRPSIVHASATTGLLTMPQAHFDMTRIGIALYGLWPSLEFRENFKNLKIEPALAWKTRIVQIKKIKNGTPVGYGITEKVKKDSVVAVLPVGYYDGYMRALSGVGEVLIGGKRCKILGRISMNLSVVDISGYRQSKVGDEVVLIGRQGKEAVTAEELAGKAGTISYEIVSRINPLLPRIYLD